MAIKNLFGRGVGFTGGLIKWVVTRGYDIGGGPVHLPNALLGDVTLDYENEGDVGIDVNQIAGVEVQP